jgi:Outer membrane protein beta-barrel domain
MKKIMLFILAVTTIYPLFSQNIRLGIKGGLNLANEKIKSQNFSRKDDAIASFHAGFVLDVALTENLYAQPQLLISGKGSKDVNLVYRPYYVELPLNILYKYEVNDGLKIYGGLGPGIGFGVFGNLRNLDNNFNRSLKFGEVTNADYKTIDFTGGFELGAELNEKLGFGIGYRWSFADVTPGNVKVTHKVVNFSLAYFFGGNGAQTKAKNNKAGSRSTRKRG